MSGYKTMPQQDYYEILGVKRDATPDEIRKAYLKLAHKYHPDRTGGDKVAEDKLKEINQVYDTLKNPEKRAQYDRFGAAGEQFAGGGGGFEGFGGFGGFGGGGGPGGGGFESPFEDFFDVLFGRGGPGGAGGRRRAATPGNDLEVRVAVTLREAAFGTKKTVKIARQEMCSECSGSGAAPGTQPQTCPDCSGTGQVRRAQGFFSITQACPKCRGTGRIVSKPCVRCNGAGRVRVQREINVDLPAGVDTGSRLRVAGEGEPGDGGGPRGDLYIYIEVMPDEIFVREGNDVICEVPITFIQAALGTTLRVPTLRGEAELKIPPGTQSGQLFRMRNQGVPDLRGYRQGDQIIKIQVETPTKLTREQRDLLEKFQALTDHQAYPLQHRFQEKLKNVRSSE